MKKFTQILGILLATSALFLTACKKKPVRDANAGVDPMGTSGVNPNDVAIAPDTTLEQRNATLDGGAHTSVVEPIYFGLDRAAVAAGERPKLQAAIKWLQDNPDKNLVLEGHCDWRGTAEYNMGLGDRRAVSVKTFLISLGADAKRLETLSKGSTDAKQGGGDAEWAKDRRVDFIELKRQ